MPAQTVFCLTSRSGFDGLQAFIEPIPGPGPGPHEVLIKVRSVALNYRDIAIATSKYPLPIKENVIPCSDMAGQVAQVGDLVDGISVGDAVIAPGSLALLYGPVKDALNTLGGLKDGVLREYIAVPAHVVIKLPQSFHSFDQWASLVTTGSTVWNAFYGYAPLKPGQTVLVLGTGGVSLTALVFAKAAGATTIITSSSDEKLEYVKATYGADHAINYKTHPNWAAEVQRITNDEGVDHVVEVGGVGTIRQSLESVSWGRVVSAIGFLTDIPKDKIPNVTFLTLATGAVLRGILGGSKQQLEEAVRFMGSRDLSMPVYKIFGFNREEVVAAFECVASGEHVGKVCIRLD